MEKGKMRGGMRRGGGVSHVKEVWTKESDDKKIQGTALGQHAFSIYSISGFFLLNFTGLHLLCNFVP